MQIRNKLTGLSKISLKNLLSKSLINGYPIKLSVINSTKSPYDNSNLSSRGFHSENKGRKNRNNYNLFLGAVTSIGIALPLLKNKEFKENEDDAIRLKSTLAQDFIKNNQSQTYIKSDKTRFFKQRTLISAVNSKHPELQMNANGACYGLVMAWYIHYLAGKDLLQTLEKIQTHIEHGVTLNQDERDLIKDINSLQEKKKGLIKIDTFNWPSSNSHFEKLLSKITEKYRIIKIDSEGMLVRPYMPELINMTEIIMRESFAKHLLKEAALSPGCLINIELRSKGLTSGHAVGLIAEKTPNGIIFRYFNPSLHEVTMTDTNKAYEKLSQLLLETKYFFVGNTVDELQERKYFHLFWNNKHFQRNRNSQLISNAEQYNHSAQNPKR